MNHDLWNSILNFDLDTPPSEYGFSTRLAFENYWTIEFTKEAILEYKKFMYLAATSEFMVSPSEIIDKVWHQHLIFTKSYQEFCELIGKQIQHIPSTHNKDEYEKFRKAKERTNMLYENIFGKQPKHIWFYNDIFESLNLIKSPFKLRTFLIFGILSIVFLSIPIYFLLKPIYLHIDNPDFIIGLTALSILTLLILESFNRSRLKNIVSEFDSSSFIYNLQPFEVIYLKTQKLSMVINGTVNELIDNGTIHINTNNTIEVSKKEIIENISHLQVVSVLSEYGTTYYPTLLKALLKKPIFWNILNSLDAFQKYFNKSKKFGNLFYLNFTVLSLLILISFTRTISGLLREKPVVYISIATILLIFITVKYLFRLTKQVSTSTIPDLYKNELLPSRQISNNWQWNYFLLGTAVLTTAFVPLVNYVDRNNSNNSSCGSACGSSCGSSCSSCGGCGGD